MNTLKFLILVIAIGASAAVRAEDTGPYQAGAIYSGDLANAEAGLLAILEKDPEDPYALLNLAFVYHKAGETAKAREIYYRILALKENPYAELASGEAERVKSVAMRGIERVEAE